MQIRLFPKLLTRPAKYVFWSDCPLCGGAGTDRAVLKRKNYRFGLSLIPLPSEGVFLRECDSCGLLFKSAIPSSESLAQILAAEAVNEWKPKSGDHPSVPQLRAIIADAQKVDVLDIGASNGDLLRGLAPHSDRLSAFDAVRYPICDATVTGEYIIGSFDGEPQWSGTPYDLVTAFDVFEHFLKPQKAIQNLLDFLKLGGRLVIETGNWLAAKPNLSAWYYCNLVEHQIFWSQKTFEYLCQTFDLDLCQCESVNHKYRRDMPAAKRIAISTYRLAANLAALRKVATFSFGVDPRLLSPPGLRDHLFVVVQRKASTSSSQVKNRANAPGGDDSRKRA